MSDQSPAPAVPAETAPQDNETNETSGETFPPYTVRQPEPLNEAGAVALFSLLTPGGAEVRFTLRTATGRELIDEILDTAKYAMTKGFKAVEGPHKPPTHSPPPSKPATPPAAKQPGANPPPATQANQPPAAQPGTAESGQQLSMDVVRMEVTPLEGGKWRFEWMQAGHKFQDIFAVWPLNRGIAVLAATGPWEESHFPNKKTAFEVNYRIYYKLGKANAQGNPYKDILRIEKL